MANNERLICESGALEEKAKGIRFALPERGTHSTGFAIRYAGQVYAYVNACAHVPIELDWNEGDFFDTSRHYLLCATHGAHYRPHDGYCVMGPCKGKRLEQLKVVEREGQVFVSLPDNSN